MSNMHSMFVFLVLHYITPNAECTCDSLPFSAGGFRYQRSCNATFDEAEKRCVEMRGHLASIHSEKENNIVHEMSEIHQNYTSYSDFTWIGLRRKGKTWEWTDGTPLDFTKWSAEEPNNYMNRDEKCAQMYTVQLSTWSPNTNNFEWNDVNCEIKMSFFVCKIKDKTMRRKRI